MPTYRVTHRATREAHTVEAPYAVEACKALGWMLGDCHVALLRESPFTDMAKMGAPRERCTRSKGPGSDTLRP